MGSISQPVYVNSGVVTAITGTLANSISGNAATATKLGTSTIGSSIKPIYLNNGTATICSYELGANIKAYSGSLSSGGWAALNGKSNAPSIAIAYNSSAASWNSSTYSASLVFGCQDTRGLLDCAYNSPIVTFGGSSYGGASNDSPKWYMKLSGTSGKTYTLPTDSKTLCASDGTNASGTWGISVSGNAATATKASQDGNGSVINSTYAKLAAYNNLIHSGNEFTFVPGSYSGAVWLNYRTASGNLDGSITQYNFGNGKGGTLASISNGQFSGNAATATKLATARTLTIGNKGKTFNGTANVSWSLSEIGAAPAYSYSTTDLTAGSSSLTTGKLYFVYE